MKKLFISSLFIFIILAGCSNDESYNNAIQKGLDYIASEAYQKAEGAFELALDEKKDDKKATALLEQTVYYQDALKALDEDELDVAKETAQKVINREAGSAALIKKSEEIVLSIEELETTLTEVTKDYEAALKQFEDKKYKEADKLLGELSKKELDHSILKSIKNKVAKLKKEIESAFAAEKKAEEERIANEKAEEEQKAAEVSEENHSTPDNGDDYEFDPAGATKADSYWDDYLPGGENYDPSIHD